jgi:hypothetical protein
MFQASWIMGQDFTNHILSHLSCERANPMNTKPNHYAQEDQCKMSFLCIHFYFILYVLIQECPSGQTLKHAHASSSTIAIIAKPCHWISSQINRIIMQNGRRAINIYHLCLFCTFNISVVHSWDSYNST